MAEILKLDAFTDQVKASLAEIGKDFTADKAAFKAYVAQTLLHLQSCAGKPGYQKALVYARNNCLMFAVSAAVEDADAAELKLTLGVIQGGLALLI